MSKTSYYGVAGNGTTGLIYGGTQDNGSLLLLPNIQNATLPAGGDGGFAAVDPENDNYIYGSTPGLGIHLSTNRGVSVQDIHDGITDVDANFIAPFILDPNQPNRMLAGGRSLWRTNNVRAGGQPTWNSIRPAQSSGNNNTSAIAVAKGDSNIIWVAQNDGQVYKTNNGLDARPT